MNDEYAVMVTSKELTGTTQYLILHNQCRTNLRRYKRVWLYKYTASYSVCDLKSIGQTGQPCLIKLKEEHGKTKDY
jgi:hypothetical protein